MRNCSRCMHPYLWVAIGAAANLFLVFREGSFCFAFVIGGAARATTAGYGFDIRSSKIPMRASSTSEAPFPPLSKDDSSRMSSSKRDTIRPIHQNWWPVASISMLKCDKPNAVTLLNQKLVVFRSVVANSKGVDGNDDDSEPTEDRWTVMDDRCSHRFVPLSEGRLVESPASSFSSASGCASCHKKIQCAYHGWEFDGSTGACTKIPQKQRVDTQKDGTEKKHKTSPGVRCYPVKIAAGMVFVWADPESYETLGKSIPVPVPSYVDEWYKSRGSHTMFQRDLPYGYELLGENLVDLAHLPYSHHGVGGLDRFSMGNPLPFRMLQDAQKTRDEAVDYGQDTDPVPVATTDNNIKPLYEVELDDATNNDPIFQSMKVMRGHDAVPDGSTVRVGFYQPCHVRYTRTVASLGTKPGSQSRVVLYLCPTSSTKSRVFLINMFGAAEKKAEETTTTDESGPSPLLSASLRTRVGAALSGCNASIKKAFQAILLNLILKFKFTPVAGHMIAHEIFDGDGIFLAMQGDRMQRGGAAATKQSRARNGNGGDNDGGEQRQQQQHRKPLSYRDYQTPATSDILVHAFRRYVEQAAKRTPDPSTVDAIEPTSVTYNPDSVLRSQLLDRYESHTKDCLFCRTALEKGRALEAKLELAKTALVGASGASLAAALIGLICGRVLETSTPASSSMLRACTTTVVRMGLRIALFSGGFARLAFVLRERVATNNQKFVFVDYVHAERG